MLDDRGRPALVPEPPRAVPKGVFYRRMKSLFILGAMFTGLGILLGGGLPWLFYFLGGRVSPTVDWRLNRRHVTTTAEVIGTELMKHFHSGSRHPWKVVFEFTTEDGSREAAVGFTWDPAVGHKAPGAPIEIEYDPDDPSTARPVDGTASLMPAWVYLLIVGLLAPQLVIGLVMLSMSAVRSRRLRELLEYGVGVTGEVTRIDTVSYVSMGRKHPYDVYYSFIDHRGVRAAGRERTYQYAWAEALNPGAFVGIVFNPADPRSSALWLYGKDLEEVT